MKHEPRAIPRNRLGEHTKAILESMAGKGWLNTRQISKASGVDWEITRKYLPRCEARGLISRRAGTPIRYRLTPEWRELLERRGEKEAPHAVAERPMSPFALQGIWKN